MIAVILAHATDIVEDYYARKWRYIGWSGEPGGHLAEGSSDEDVGHGRSPRSGSVIAFPLALTPETVQFSGFLFRKAASYAYAMPAREVKML